VKFTQDPQKFLLLQPEHLLHLPSPAISIVMSTVHAMAIKQPNQTKPSSSSVASILARMAGHDVAPGDVILSTMQGCVQTKMLCGEVPFHTR